MFDSYSHKFINLSNDIFEPMWHFAFFEMSQNYSLKIIFCNLNLQVRLQNLAKTPAIFHRKFSALKVCLSFEPVF